MMQPIDNDSLYILNALYTNRSIDIYEIHTVKMIPPSTLYTTLKHEMENGVVVRNGLIYSLTDKGEVDLSERLKQYLIKPDITFKKVPESYSGEKAAVNDVNVIDII